MGPKGLLVLGEPGAKDVVHREIQDGRIFLELELNAAQVASHKVIVVTERIRKGVDRYLDPSDVEIGRSRAVVGIGGLGSVAKRWGSQGRSMG